MFSPLQVAAQYLGSLPDNSGLDVKDMDTVVYVSGNRIYIKSAAILHLLKDIGGGWGLFYVFIIIPVIIRDYIYDKIAGSRYRIFGKRGLCMVPSADIKDRFL